MTTTCQENQECCSGCAHAVVMFNLITCRLSEEKKLASDYCCRWESKFKKDLNYSDETLDWTRS